MILAACLKSYANFLRRGDLMADPWCCPNAPHTQKCACGYDPAEDPRLAREEDCRPRTLACGCAVAGFFSPKAIAAHPCPRVAS